MLIDISDRVSTQGMSTVMTSANSPGAIICSFHKMYPLDTFIKFLGRLIHCCSFLCRFNSLEMTFCDRVAAGFAVAPPS